MPGGGQGGNDVWLEIHAQPAADWSSFKSEIKGVIDELVSIAEKPIEINLKLNAKSLDNIKSEIEQVVKAASKVGDASASFSKGNSGIWLPDSYKRAAESAKDFGTAAANASKKATTATNEATKAVEKFSDAQKTAGSSSATVGTKEVALIKRIQAEYDRATNQLSKWTVSKNGSTAQQYGQLQAAQQELNGLLHAASQEGANFEQIKSQFANVQATLATVRGEIRAAGEDTATFGDRLAGLAGKFTTWFGVTRVVMAVIRTVKQMVNASIEVESAMAQIQVVTGATDAEMQSFFTTATAMAKELGTSITDISKSIENFSRLGYGLEDASELAKYATILSNTADTDVGTATTGMISVIKGFNLETKDAEHVADLLIKVGQEYAISAEELMTAFERGGSALNASGTSLEKSAALFAAANASLKCWRAA